ncbi:MAG: hypothetical protein AAGI63_17555 [Planctomycetota bacterium]
MIEFRGINTVVWCAILLSLTGCGKESSSDLAQTTNATPSDSVDPPKEISDSLVESPPSMDNSVGDEDFSAGDSTLNETTDGEPTAETPGGNGDAMVSTTDAETNADGVDGDGVDADQTLDSAMQDVASSQVPTEPHLRVLLPTTAGPILMDIEIQIDETALETAFDEEVESVLAELGEPSEVTWKSLLEKISSDQNRFGRPMFQPAQVDNVIRLFDTNRNKRPDPREAAKILFRRSQTDRSFRVDGTDSFRGFNRAQSQLLKAMDKNEDRSVDASEVERCVEAIMRLDQNGDGRIERGEVLTDLEPNDPSWNRRRSTRWGDVAMDLSGYVDWQMLAYTFESSAQRGAFDSDLTLLERLDTDEDGSLSAEEAKQLREIEPDVQLFVRFPEVGATTPDVEMVTVAPWLRSRVSVTHGQGQVWFESDSLVLLVRASDLLGRDDLIPDEAFALLDANKNGGLDEDEIPPGALREYSFEDVDANEDGKLTRDEIRSALAQQTTIWNKQVRGRAAESRDAVFDWLDQNHDQMLSARELRDLPQWLAERADPEGTLQHELIPDAFHLVLGRGDPDRNDQLFTMDATDRMVSESRPRWAQAMDSNGDGDIDAAEFIGSPEQFRSLDQNDDGFIDTIEAGGSMGGAE